MGLVLKLQEMRKGSKNHKHCLRSFNMCSEYFRCTVYSLNELSRCLTYNNDGLIVVNLCSKGGLILLKKCHRLNVRQLYFFLVLANHDFSLGFR